MAASTLTSKGQVTIPKEIRQLLGLKEGDRLEFRLDDQGKVVIQPETEGPLGRLPGMLRHLARKKPVTIEEMKEAVRRRARQKDLAARTEP
jgi:antitoxin PrlF